MGGDTVLLSRIQFAFTIGYHILWPAWSIGISGYIVILNLLWMGTRRSVWHDLMRFWIHLFALGFAMGVVTGVVISYEIGTNWSTFANQVSNVIGPFFTYEVMTAFFLEAGFIGIMLFGMNRVSPVFHFASCLMVALGALLSAFWILAANSWMQTPAGFTISGGKFQIADWTRAIFSPSFPYRFAHMVTAAYVAGTFVVLGVLGFHLWAGRHREFARAGFSVAMWMALILTPLQIVLGDMHGRNTFEYQPIKVAAMEGDWRFVLREVSPSRLSAVARRRHDTRLHRCRVEHRTGTKHPRGASPACAVCPNDCRFDLLSATGRWPAKPARLRERGCGDRHQSSICKAAAGGAA